MMKTEPKEELTWFVATVPTFGRVWCELVERNAGIYVVGGISGNMTGVPVALFPYSERDTANRYAKDFADGKVFAAMNGRRWNAYIDAAHACKRMNSTLVWSLKNRGRISGLTADGREVFASKLVSEYINGSL